MYKWLSPYLKKKKKSLEKATENGNQMTDQQPKHDIQVPESQKNFYRKFL